MKVKVRIHTTMKFLFTLSICLVTIGGYAQKSPTRWYKGNLHAHSYWSDANEFPEMVMDWYKSHGYDFVALSDHNTLAGGDKWKVISDRALHQEGFKRYLERYGESWVNYKKDSAGHISVKLKTFEEYRSLFEEKGRFLILEAEEISKGVHIGAVNIKEPIIPSAETKTSLELAQSMIDQVYEQRSRTGQLMFAHVNHPNFGSSLSAQDMMKLRGDRFFEVFNGHPLVQNYGTSKKPSMDALWDMLLINCVKKGKPVIYGLATDDTHDYLEYGVGKSNAGRGWIMVRSKELETNSLIESMERGDFYATTGIELHDVTGGNNRLKVEIESEEGVEYTIQFWGARKSQDAAELLKEIKGSKGAYKLSGKDLYVRAKIISSKLKENPYQKGDYETAWTQPIMNK